VVLRTPIAFGRIHRGWGGVFDEQLSDLLLCLWSASPMVHRVHPGFWFSVSSSVQTLVVATESGPSWENGFLGRAMNASIYFVAATKFLGRRRKPAPQLVWVCGLEIMEGAGPRARTQSTWGSF
jgi:hypothetical protein